MTNLKQKFLALGIACLVSFGAFAQKDKDKRPPKGQDKVVSEQKAPKEKPQNNNQGGKRNDDKKGKP